jgi:hypothetical protein
VLTQILAWADARHARTACWPRKDSGPVRFNLNENWRNIDNALRYGLRGLPGKSSLARFLAEQRGVRNKQALPPLTEDLILRWAEEHFRATGDWPTVLSGCVPAAPDEFWANLNMALHEGGRGLPGGSSLARLLEARRGVPNRNNLPRFTVAIILEWADAWHRRTGGWPHKTIGPIPESPGNTWHAVNDALRMGNRGIAGGDSLAELLRRERGVRNRARLPRLTLKGIVAWAEGHRLRTGDWPGVTSGTIPEAPGENWHAVNLALHCGLRGLRPGGSSAKLLCLRRGEKSGRHLPR